MDVPQDPSNPREVVVAARQRTEGPALLAPQHAIDDLPHHLAAEEAAVDRALEAFEQPESSRTTAPPSSAVIGVEEMPRGVPPGGANESSISRSISPTSVASTSIVTMRTGSPGLASASHSAGSGTARTR